MTQGAPVSSCWWLLLLLAALAAPNGTLAANLRAQSSAGRGEIDARAAVSRRDVPPGDVSGVGDLADTIHQAGVGKAADVVGQVSSAVAEDLAGAARAAEAAIADPVGAIGGAAEAVGDALEKESYVPEAEPPPNLEHASPESSYEGLRDFTVPVTQPPLAPFGGVYCRGAACQYRVPPPPTPFPGAPSAMQPAVMGANGLQQLPPGFPCVGPHCPVPPAELEVLKFVRGCQHILDQAPGGHNNDGAVRGVVETLCRRALPLQAAACPGYGDVVAAALAARGDEAQAPPPLTQLLDPPAAPAACLRLQRFVSSARQASVYLGVSAASGAAGSAGAAGEAGPCTPRGREWRTWWTKRHGGQTVPPAVALAVAAATLERSGLRRGTALFQASDVPDTANAGGNCSSEDGAVPLAQTEYMLAPGMPDGSVKPTLVGGVEFRRCTDQLEEISFRKPHTLPAMARLTEQWCGFQISAAPADDPAGTPRRPEWDFANCTAMSQLLVFAMRGDLQPKGGVLAVPACTNLFLASMTLDAVHAMMTGAWSLGERTPVVGGAPATPQELAQRKLAGEMAEAAKGFLTRLRRQQQLDQAVNRGKAAIAAWGGG